MYTHFVICSCACVCLCNVIVKSKHMQDALITHPCLLDAFHVCFNVCISLECAGVYKLSSSVLCVCHVKYLLIIIIIMKFSLMCACMDIDCCLLYGKYLMDICLQSFRNDDFLLYAHQLIGSTILPMEILLLLLLLLLLFLFILTTDHLMRLFAFISIQRKGNMQQQQNWEINVQMKKRTSTCILYVCRF